MGLFYPACDGGDLAGLDAQRAFSDSVDQQHVQEIAPVDLGLTKEERVDRDDALPMAQQCLHLVGLRLAPGVGNQQRGAGWLGG